MDGPSPESGEGSCSEHVSSNDNGKQALFLLENALCVT